MGNAVVGCGWVSVGFSWVFRGMPQAEGFGFHELKCVGPGCVAGGAWIKALARSAPRRRAQRTPHLEVCPTGWFGRILLSPDLARCLDAGEGALADQALEVAGEDRAVEAPSGGAHFIESGFPDGVARGEAQDVPADQFPETFAGLVPEDGGFGERLVRERLAADQGDRTTGTAMPRDTAKNPGSQPPPPHRQQDLLLYG